MCVKHNDEFSSYASLFHVREPRAVLYLDALFIDAVCVPVIMLRSGNRRASAERVPRTSHLTTRKTNHIQNRIWQRAQILLLNKLTHPILFSNFLVFGHFDVFWWEVKINTVKFRDRGQSGMRRWMCSVRWAKDYIYILRCDAHRRDLKGANFGWIPQILNYVTLLLLFTCLLR